MSRHEIDFDRPHAGDDADAAAISSDALAPRFRLPLLRFFERRVKSREDAEELTQEVFVRLLRRPDIEHVANIEGFVFITAANLLKDYYRGRTRRGASRTESIDGVDLESPAPNPRKIVEDRAELRVLLKAIEELSPKCRAVFVLHRLEEIPHAEIARRMGISVSMVEKHIAAALVQLRKRLKDGAGG